MKPPQPEISRYNAHCKGQIPPSCQAHASFWKHARDIKKSMIPDHEKNGISQTAGNTT
jgi:hypothetical protein